MHPLRAMLICLIGIGAYAQILRIEPGDIRAGQSATLSWQNVGASAFLMGLGRKVAGDGSVVMTPAVSTDFTLVVESEAGVNYRTARLYVNGARGDDGYPSLADFGVPIQGKRLGIGYVDFQSAVWTTLQSEGYGVKGDYVPKRPFVTFYTEFALRPDLISKTEKIRARRLALAVDIYEPMKPGAIAFGVRPSLEFQRRGEDEWWPERQSSRARAEAVKMVQFLERSQ